MPFREKSAWITLVTTLIVYGGYFLLVGSRLHASDAGVTDLVALACGATVLLVVLHIGLVAAASVIDPEGARAPRDERERMVELRADRAGFYALQAGAFSAIVAVLWWKDAAVMANVVFLAMVVAELARAGATISGFRQVHL